MTSRFVARAPTSLWYAPRVPPAEEMRKNGSSVGSSALFRVTRMVLRAAGGGATPALSASMWDASPSRVGNS